MSYLVLARKHRPSTFDEVIGQEHITEILKQSIKNNRVAHAYLFCGPRGIGKTSCARILAKCLNCEKGPTLKPPKDSKICAEIDAGRSFDVLEIDGASNRGIDEIRAIRENVKFAPSYGRFKIYIVDEVHMLTPEAFNALLKTLEEPPEHVKFIFATTDVNKLPPTIISRCQRFDFKRIPLKTILAHLTDICKKEKFKIEDDALLAIGKAAQGGLRDALSILDQVSALADKKIKVEDITSMLGTVETQLLFDVVDAVGEKDCSKALKILDHIIEQGKDVRQLSKDLTEHFRNLMIIKVGGKALGKLVDYPVAIKEMYLKQTEKFMLKDILVAIETLISAQDVARITESLRMPIEIAFAKLTYQAQNDLPSFNVPPAKKAARQPAKRSAPAVALKSERGEVDVSKDDADEGEEESLDIDPNLVSVDLDIEKIRNAWQALTHAVSREKMFVATYLQEGNPYKLVGTSKGSTLTISYSKEHEFHVESLQEKELVKLVEKVLTQNLNTPIQINYKIVDDYIPPQNDESVQSTIDVFNGKVVNQWHNE